MADPLKGAGGLFCVHIQSCIVVSTALKSEEFHRAPKKILVVYFQVDFDLFINFFLHIFGARLSSPRPSTGGVWKWV